MSHFTLRARAAPFLRSVPMLVSVPICRCCSPNSTTSEVPMRANKKISTVLISSSVALAMLGTAVPALAAASAASGSFNGKSSGFHQIMQAVDTNGDGIYGRPEVPGELPPDTRPPAVPPLTLAPRTVAASGETAGAVQFGLADTSSTELMKATDDPSTPENETLNELWAFCLEPFVDFNINADATVTALKIDATKAPASVRFLMSKVPVYTADANPATATSDKPIGLLADRTSQAYVGTPISTKLTAGTITASAKTQEYAAIALAVRKILDPAFVFTQINDAIEAPLTARATEYVNAANAASATFVDVDPNQTYGVELDVKVADAPTAGQSTITVTATGLNGTSGNPAPLAGKTLRLWNASADLDPATPGVQTSVTSQQTNAQGVVTFTVAKAATSTPVTVVLDKAIAPGTLLSPQQIPPTAPGGTPLAAVNVQKFVTASWARKVASATVPSLTGAATPTSGPATTAPSTKMPYTGPITTLPMLILAALLGAVGIFVRRRPEAQ